MPTPVSTARQCLTPEASQALDDSVAVARRRGHSQTTSLHAVSALLSLPSSGSGTSILREACSRARDCTYSARLQFKALDLCLSVSLDRLPSSSASGGANSDDEPPVSNSLMAAIKRSQANQRRQPGNFSLYQQISPQQSQLSSSTTPIIKVELRNLILSILDDPIVSRVFSEAGFNSSQIKLALIRPISKLNRSPLLGFSFPFSGYYSGIYSSDHDYYRRICEVIIKGSSPMLVGACACDMLVGFCDAIEKRRDGQCVLPQELLGLRVVSFENLDDINNEKQSFGVGVVVNFGDLNEFVGGNSGVVSSVGGKLTTLLDQYGRKMWLIGAANSGEVYSKFVDKFPNIEKDWNLHVFPISTWRNSMLESFPRSSLMESFVPFGGFFTTASDLHSPLTSTYRCLTLCNLCNEKCEQEIDAVSRGGFTTSVADQYRSSLPSWLQMAEIGAYPGFDLKTGGDGMVLRTKVAGLRTKWSNICQRLHRSPPPVSDIHHHHHLANVFGFQATRNKYKHVETYHENCTSSQLIGNRSVDVESEFPVHLKISAEDFESGGHSFSNSSTTASSTLLTSTKTDLGLKISSLPPGNEPKQQSKSRDFSGPLSANVDNPATSPSPNFIGPSDPRNFKKLYKALAEKVSGQEEAIGVLSETIARCRMTNEQFQRTEQRPHVWLNFAGHDRCGKRKTAVALAENLYGGSQSFISVDLSPQETNNHAFLFWGKTLVDYIVMEISKKPKSVIFLENVDKADTQTQNSLSHAIRTGKFADSHGREVGIHDSVFVTTTSNFPENKELCHYTEERVIQAKARLLQISVESACRDKIDQLLSLGLFPSKRKLVGTSQNSEPHEITETMKRAHLTGTRNLDLNLPAEESNLDETCNIDSIADAITKGWLQEFLDQVDRNIIFKPFDFDALANRLLAKINNTFHNIVGSESMMHIDPEVIDQLLAAEYLSDNNGTKLVDDWIDQILGTGFFELRRRHVLDANSTVKLVTCDATSGVKEFDHIPGVHLLPRKIIVK